MPSSDMRDALVDIADRVVAFEPGTKGRGYYEIYDRYFHDFAQPNTTILELGVYHGQSTKVFASYFEDGHVVAVDNLDRGLDFSAFPNVVFERADQRSSGELVAIQKKHAPRGFDIIIDDCSHIGAWSRASYETLFALLKPRGLYVIEDWGTGYWSDWPDGRSQRRPISGKVANWLRGTRITSHDYGMVGFLKSLVDDLSDGRTRSNDSSRPPTLDFIHIYSGLAVIKKS